MSAASVLHKKGSLGSKLSTLIKGNLTHFEVRTFILSLDVLL